MCFIEDLYYTFQVGKIFFNWAALKAENFSTAVSRNATLFWAPVTQPQRHSCIENTKICC